MVKLFGAMMIMIVSCAQAQVAQPVPPAAGRQQATAVADDVSSAPRLVGKVGLVRGVVKRLDSIHDELLVHAFGGGDVRIAFDPRTQLLSENTQRRFTSIPAGSVVSVDTVIDGGKLFAVSVRTGSSDSASELNGQIVRYDEATSRLTLREPISPKESISLRVTPSTTVVNLGQAASPQALSPGTLVRVLFSPTKRAADRIEILAARGASFSFSGRIVAVDLRSRVLALFNDSDQSIRELAIGSLDISNLGSLREGADVRIQAEFDGQRYNARSITPVPLNPTPVSNNP